MDKSLVAITDLMRTVIRQVKNVYVNLVSWVYFVEFIVDSRHDARQKVAPRHNVQHMDAMMFDHVVNPHCHLQLRISTSFYQYWEMEIGRLFMSASQFYIKTGDTFVCFWCPSIWHVVLCLIYFYRFFVRVGAGMELKERPAINQLALTFLDLNVVDARNEITNYQIKPNPQFDLGYWPTWMTDGVEAMGI